MFSEGSVIHKLSMIAGKNAKIYIGIAEEEGSLISHAWVEIEGIPYYYEPNKNINLLLITDDIRLFFVIEKIVICHKMRN